VEYKEEHVCSLVFMARLTSILIVSRRTNLGRILLKGDTITLIQPA